jgi:dihydroorotate dehydrogenase (fumarate)
MRTDTSYLGFRLPHPFIAGASPLGHHFDTVRRLEDAGCAAVVLHSLFEEQITAAHQGRVRHMNPDDPMFAETWAYFPPPSRYAMPPDVYAEHIRRLKESVGIPVIGSLNGTSQESWLKFAYVIEQAGADALELNLYELVSDPRMPAAAVEMQLVGIVREVKRRLKIPVAVKVTPYFTAFGHFARQLDEAGADALVLFNRFYQNDIDAETMKVAPHVELSTSHELLLRLHWLALLHGRVRPALAVTGGVATPIDAVKAILSGADAVQLVSALLRNGTQYVQTMIAGLERWMEGHEIERIDQMRGRASFETVTDPESLERANYIRTLQSWGAETWPQSH